MSRAGSVVSGLVALACAACSSIRTDFDYDTSFDFSKLRTYEWMLEPAGIAPAQALASDRIRTAVDSELATLGYRKTSTDPDFLLAAHATRQGKVAVEGYGPWWRGGVNVYRYNEDSLVLDIVDARTKRLVWRGIGQGTEQPHLTPEERTQRVNEAVHELLGAFPPGGPPPAKAESGSEARK